MTLAPVALVNVCHAKKLRPYVRQPKPEVNRGAHGDAWSASINCLEHRMKHSKMGRLPSTSGACSCTLARASRMQGLSVPLRISATFASPKRTAISWFYNTPHAARQPPGSLYPARCSCPGTGDRAWTCSARLSRHSPQTLDQHVPSLPDGARRVAHRWLKLILSMPALVSWIDTIGCPRSPCVSPTFGIRDVICSPVFRSPRDMNATKSASVREATACSRCFSASVLVAVLLSLCTAVTPGRCRRG